MKSYDIILKFILEFYQSLMFMAFQFCDVGELNLLSSCKHGYIVSFRLQLALFLYGKLIQQQNQRCKKGFELPMTWKPWLKSGLD